MNRKILCYLVIALVFFSSCVTPFTPEGVNTVGGTLVVEGDIILNDTTRVFLSTSISLEENNAVSYITNATVWVESESGSKYFGALEKNADLLSPHFAINTNGLNVNEKYKLCITLSDGKNYESDLLNVLVSPPIDSIGFIVNSDKTAVNFYVNTHDDNSASRYYKWRYREDWEFHSYFQTNYYYNIDSGKVFEFQNGENIYNCWNKAMSTSILIAKNDQLENNIVYQKTLNTIKNVERKINYIYCMELHQFSISEEAYKYWATLEKNSDNIGGIFAPQPSELSGNIHCVSNPDEKVLGYISAGTNSSKRVFFNRASMGIQYASEGCELIESPEPDRILREQLYIIDPPVGMWATKECVDCRTHGTKDRPSFWPNDDI